MIEYTTFFQSKNHFNKKNGGGYACRVKIKTLSGKRGFNTFWCIKKPN